jgi:hypothetical protein
MKILALILLPLILLSPVALPANNGGGKDKDKKEQTEGNQVEDETTEEKPESKPAKYNRPVHETREDSVSTSRNRYNFIFYFIYKYKYNSPTESLRKLFN